MHKKKGIIDIEIAFMAYDYQHRGLLSQKEAQTLIAFYVGEPLKCQPT